MKSKTINDKMNIIGTNLRKYRKLRGYTLRSFCDRLELLGVTMYHTEIQRIEHNLRAVKDFEALAFCIALNISLDQLYENCKKEFE